MNQSKEVSKVNSSVDDIGKSTQEFSQLTSNSISSIPMVDLHACGICFQLYDETVRVPKILFCGHTYCLSCMNSLVHHNGPFPMCPVCRKITRQRVEKLPNNFQLLQILSRFELLSTENLSHLKEPRERDITDHQQSSIEEILNQIDNEMDIIFSVIETQLDAMRIVDSPAFETNSRFLNSQRHSYSVMDNKLVDFQTSFEQVKYSLQCINSEHNRYLHRDMRNPNDVISNLARDSNLIAEFLEQDGLSNDIVSQHGVAATSGSNDMVHYRSIFDDESGEMIRNSYENYSLYGSVNEDDDHHSRFSFDINDHYNLLSPENVMVSNSGDNSRTECILCNCRVPSDSYSQIVHIQGRRHQQMLANLERVSPAIGSPPQNRFSRRNRRERRRRNGTRREWRGTTNNHLEPDPLHFMASTPLNFVLDHIANEFLHLNGMRIDDERGTSADRSDINNGQEYFAHARRWNLLSRHVSHSESD